jgi:hypothetical protein
MGIECALAGCVRNQANSKGDNMKIGFLVLGVALLFGGCSHVTTVKNVKTVTFKELTADRAPIGEVFKKGEGLVIHVEKGDKVPVELTAVFPFGELSAGENTLHAAEDFYLYVSPKEGLMISRDGVQFAAVQNIKGIKKIYGFKSGHVSLGFRVTKETPLELQAGVVVQP